ncbi:restriction endonuclease subunit S [Acinetobacter towneri]|uniref:restriction endonuclease subunit S n=1 Tax=Acinetobacter towneri TaxID=202956 RepID=UPI00209ACEEE|nr:restriction endonuclease subunit S [Acinetobacter towneri]MCO8055515.1 restriction endonuclease subunit S [Acinetobacter towneri]
MTYPQVDLGSVVDLQAGIGFPTRLQGKTSGKFPFAKVGDISRNGRTGKPILSTVDNYIDQTDVESLRAKIIPEGSILFAKIGEAIKQNHRVISHRSLLIDNNAMAAIPSEKIDNLYLYYFLKQVDFYRLAPATTVPALRKSDLEKIKIPLPPLAEQRRIASILDKADELRQKRQQAIEKLDQLLQATFIDMFGDPNTYQNRFPIKSLKQVCTKITDGEHGTVERLESGKLYLMARNITKNMTLDITEVSYISEEDHQRIYKRCSPEFGDLMIVCVGATIGKLCLVPDMEEFSLARSVALLKPDNNSVISQYLLHLLASDYMQQKILNSRNTAAQAGLYLGKLSIIEVPVPPKELQEKWSKIALSIEDQKQKLYKQLDVQNQLFISLQNQAFSGNL